jgi:uncharacterized Zn-binding protein involved in type VI secretion
MLPAAFLTCLQVCPFVNPADFVPHVGWPILETTADNIILGVLPAAVIGSTALCIGMPATVIHGSPIFFADVLPVATTVMETDHGGIIVEGEPTVLV